MDKNSDRYRHLLRKSREGLLGHDAWVVMSRGEKLAVALVLNHADWLIEAGYTLAGAIGSLQPDWLVAIPLVEQELADEVLAKDV